MADTILNTGKGEDSKEFEKIIKEIKELEDIVGKGEHTPEEKERIAVRVKELRDSVVELERMRKQDMIRAAQDVQELGGEMAEQETLIADLVTRLAALQSQNPHGYATFVRFIGMEKPDPNAKELPVIEVRGNDGKLAQVSFLVKEVDPKTLKYGQLLIASCASGPNHIIGVSDGFSADGSEAVVRELLGSDREGVRVLVTIGREDSAEKIVVRLASGVLQESVVEGSRVLVDADAKLVFEVLPPQKSTAYVVSEMPSVTFKDIGGHDSLIAEIDQKIAWPILYPEVYEKLGLPDAKGFCLEGPPGVGKTMLVKAILNRLSELLEKKHGVPVHGHFFSVAGPEFQVKWVGDTEERMRNLFKTAKEAASPTSPAIIFIDEAESIFPIRGSGISSDTEKTNVPQFTALMDGLTNRGNVIVILATNRVDLMDGAVIRPGRCDKKISVLRPNKEAARDIFKKYLLPGHVHPKYLEHSIYVPKDRNGRPRRGDGGKKIELRLDRSSTKAANYLISEAVRRMYDEHIKENQFLSVKFKGEKEWTHLRYGDFASGALIANIVDRAKHYAAARVITTAESKDKALGVEKKDLMRAIEEVFSELRAPQTLGFHDRLAIEGIGRGKRVEDYKFIPGCDTIAEEDD
ncbi:MAG: AAA family ATPase [Patescibacteria group bacterium]